MDLPPSMGDALTHTFAPLEIGEDDEDYCYEDNDRIHAKDDDHHSFGIRTTTADEDDDAEETKGLTSMASAIPDTTTAAAATTTAIAVSAASLTKARRLLYVSRFCYHVSELAWDFGSALWLAALGNNSSLFWVSAYSATVRLVVIALVPILSSKIDKNNTTTRNSSSSSNNNNKNKNPEYVNANTTSDSSSSTPTITTSNRSRLISLWILGQHTLVMLTILLVFGNLRLREQWNNDESVDDGDHQLEEEESSQLLVQRRLGMVLLCLCGGLAQVLHLGLEVAIERDWVVVMAEEAEKLRAVGDEQQQQQQQDEDGFRDEEENPPASAAAIAAAADSVALPMVPSSSSSSPSSSPSSSWLQETNVALRQIYLVCEILGPVLMGSVFSFARDHSLWVVFHMKAFSMVIVLVCMRKLCLWVPALQNQPTTASSAARRRDDDEESDDDASGLLRHSGEEHEEEGTSLEGKASSASDTNTAANRNPLSVYFSQTGLVGAGIALALLYANVLTFGGMMVAYLAENGGMTAASIGIWKGVSNVASVAGTIWFARSKLPDVEQKGLCSLSIQFSCLTISVIGIAMGQMQHKQQQQQQQQQSSLSSSKLVTIGSVLVIAGVIPSRLGLWGYDLSVTQLYQKRVLPSLRGTVGGTQTILNNALEFLPFVLTMVVASDVKDFWIVMVAGYCAMGTALASYWIGTYRYYKDHKHHHKANTDSEVL